MDPWRHWAGRRVLILGAAGFVGRWVGRVLARSGADLDLAVRSPGDSVRVLDRWGVRGTVHAVDLSSEGAAYELVRAASPDVLFNLAGYGVDRSERDEALAERLNAALPPELVDALAEGPRASDPVLVHVGSALEYGAIAGDLAEDSTPAATTLYGRTKLAGTRAVSARAAETGVRAVTARLFTVYGPGEHAGRLLPTLVEAARSGARVPLTAGAQRRDFTWVGDVAEGLLRLARATCPDALGPGPAVNLATGRLTSVRAFCEAAAGVLGLPADRLDFGALPTRAEEMEHGDVAVGRLRGLTGWVPATPVVEGLERTRAWEAGAR